MSAESITLTVILTFAIGVAGWWILRSRRKPQRTVDRLAPEYLKGLNYLLAEQSDKAIEVFVRMAELDSDTVETHLALGHLFRRRGEVDRAIRIHQNIIARPNLDRPYRELASFALGEDYMGAGLYDRAEHFFQELKQSRTHKVAALRNLLWIYEQEKEWARAVEVQTELRKAGEPVQNNAVAHYYCELAARARQNQDLKSARQYLKKARHSAKNGVRSAIMRAEVALDEGDKKLARRLYGSVLERHSAFAALLMPQLARCCSGEHLGTLLDEVEQNKPETAPDFGYALLMHPDIDGPNRPHYAEAFIQHSKALSTLLRPFGFPATEQEARDGAFAALTALVTERHRSACAVCGYASATFHWQCPSCKSWDTVAPYDALLFDHV